MNKATLADGTYEAMVVDAVDLDDDALRLDVTLLDAHHRGELVTVRATGLGLDAIALLATPCTLVVTGGNPRVVLDQL